VPAPETLLMTDEVELVGDRDGVAIIGDPTAVDRFIANQGLEAMEMDLARFLPSATTLASAGAAVSTASQVVANAGRWVKLSEQSAAVFKNSRMMTGSDGSLVRAIAMNADGSRTTAILEIVKNGSLLANPAVLAGVGGIMSQMAMQKAMDDIQDYLAVIDQKVDDILRAQKNSVLADMIGVGLALDEAMTLREEVGRVSEVTWSKVQGTGFTIASVQSYSLGALDALAEKLERQTHVDDLAKTSKDAAKVVHEWLVVLARCFQLQDALAVLELDRVLDASPEELDRHRVGLAKARAKRREQIVQTTTRLLARIDAMAKLTNGEILRNPFNSQTVMRTVERTGSDIVQFQTVLGVVAKREALETKSWRGAAGEVRDDMVEAGTDGVKVAARFANDTVEKTRQSFGNLTSDVSKRLLRQKDQGD
jgi:hypothetical protein